MLQLICDLVCMRKSRLQQVNSTSNMLGCACAGLFKAWALVGARLYSVPLRVPRRFYVNSVLPPEDPESPAQTLGGLRVNRTLPFGREAFHIYEASSAPAILLAVKPG